jgi:hypothetical protein
MADAPKQPVEATMKSLLPTAALLGSVIGILYVIVDAIAHALWAGWDGVKQPGYWTEKAIGFLIISTLFTILISWGKADRVRKQGGS